MGNKLSSVTVGTGPLQTTLNIDVNVNAYALAPALIGAAKPKVLGAHFGAYMLPTFQNASLGALMSNISGAGRSATAGQFIVGDIFVQPVSLPRGVTYLPRRPTTRVWVSGRTRTRVRYTSAPWLTGGWPWRTVSHGKSTRRRGTSI